MAKSNYTGGGAYTLNEVKAALSCDPDKLDKLAESMKRSKSALVTLRYHAKNLLGHPEYSIPYGALVKEFFITYFNEGNQINWDVAVHPLQKTEKKVEAPTEDQATTAQADDCEKSIKDVMQNLDNGMGYFKKEVAKLAGLVITHRNHLLVQKMKNLEKETVQLRAEKEELERKLSEANSSPEPTPTVKETVEESSEDDSFAKLIAGTL